MNQLFCRILSRPRTGGAGTAVSVIRCAVLACMAVFALSSTFAAPYTSSSSYTATGPAGSQPIIRWYRYYSSSGQPSLSSTITDQHLKYGYEALDRNMQVIKRVPPYSAASHARQKARRDAEQAKRQSDMHLRQTYGSVAQASAKRNQMLADMTSRKTFLQNQLTGLQRLLSQDIAQAASYERQNKPIPAMLQKSIADNKKNVREAQQNIQAINERQQQVIEQYDAIIRRLQAM